MKNRRIKLKIKEKFLKIKDELTTEQFLVFCDHEYLCYRAPNLAVGNDIVQSVYIDVTALVTMLRNKGVSTCYIAHNHPNDERTPSQMDIDATKTLHGVLKNFGINLLGSYVYTSDGVWEVLPGIKKNKL